MKIFFGPTRPSNIPADADLRPPAQQGDIAAAALEGPDTLILLDGFFHQSLAPWHKEILFAIEQGCRVIGAGSLGALRAVECARYGAEPVGLIAEWYADGTCTDDADVAVAHGPASEDYKSYTIPLVNIRATLDALSADRFLPTAEARKHLATISRIYYAERTWSAIEAVLPALDFQALKHNLIDQKAKDAKAAIRHAQQAPPPATRDLPQHIHTAYFTALLANDLPTSNGQRQHHLASETDRTLATDRHLVAELAQLIGIVTTPEDIFAASTRMWHRLGITDSETAKAWLAANAWTDQQWFAHAQREALRQAARDWHNASGACLDTVPLTLAHNLLNPA